MSSYPPTPRRSLRLYPRPPRAIVRAGRPAALPAQFADEETPATIPYGLPTRAVGTGRVRRIDLRDRVVASGTIDCPPPVQPAERDAPPTPSVQIASARSPRIRAAVLIALVAAAVVATVCLRALV